MMRRRLLGAALCASAVSLAAGLGNSQTTAVSRQVSELVGKRDYPAAEKLLIDAIQADRRNAPLLRALGGVFFLDGKYLNCASALEKAKAANILDESSRMTLAMAYVNLDRPAWAREELNNLVAAHPKQSLYYYWLGRLDFGEQKFQMAIGEFHTAIRFDPQSARSYDSLGLCNQAAGNTGESLRNFHRAVELNRKAREPSPWPSYDLGVLLIETGNAAGARSNFKESLRIDPRLAKAHYRLGLADEKLSDYDAAVLELNGAIRLDASYPEPYYALARIYRRRNQKQLAGDATNTFEKLNKHRSRDIRE